MDATPASKDRSPGTPDGPLATELSDHNLRGEP
jgi:hypothetical protein